jgi:hypothetical protein
MLPDFPRIKRHIRDTSSHLVREAVKKHPTLSQIQSHQIFEGDRTAIRDDDSKRDTPLEEIAIPVQLDRHTIIEKGASLVFEQVPVIAAKMIGHHLQMLVRGVTEAVEHTGNAVHADGQPFTQDLYLQLLQTVEIDFDEDGTPQIPSAFHPDYAVQARIEARLREWIEDPSFRARVEEVIAVKRQEWNDRESNRTLVD